MKIDLPEFCRDSHTVLVAQCDFSSRFDQELHCINDLRVIRGAGSRIDTAWLIFQLQKRDSAAADRVYYACLNNPNSRSLSRLLWLAGYPFGYGESLGGSTDPMQFTGISGFNFPTLKDNRVLAAAFLSIADQSIVATLNMTNDATPEEAEALTGLVFFAVTYLLPEAEKYRPDLYAPWATLKNQTSQRINPSRRDAILSK